VARLAGHLLDGPATPRVRRVVLRLLGNIDDGVLVFVAGPGGLRQRLEDLIPAEDELREDLNNLLADRLDDTGQVKTYHPPSPFSPGLINPEWLAEHSVGDDLSLRCGSSAGSSGNVPTRSCWACFARCPRWERSRAMWWLTDLRVLLYDEAQSEAGFMEAVARLDRVLKLAPS